MVSLSSACLLHKLLALKYSTDDVGGGELTYSVFLSVFSSGSWTYSLCPCCLLCGLLVLDLGSPLDWWVEGSPDGCSRESLRVWYAWSRCSFVKSLGRSFSFLELRSATSRVSGLPQNTLTGHGQPGDLRPIRNTVLILGDGICRSVRSSQTASFSLSSLTVESVSSVISRSPQITRFWSLSFLDWSSSATVAVRAITSDSGAVWCTSLDVHSPLFFQGFLRIAKGRNCNGFVAWFGIIRDHIY